MRPLAVAPMAVHGLAHADGEIAVRANRTRRRHGREYPAQAVDQSAFLINATQRRNRKELADAVEQRSQLLRAGDVASENNDATRLHFLD